MILNLRSLSRSLGFAVWLAGSVGALSTALCFAQTPAVTNPNAPGARELVVGTKIAPPFAMKGEDGNWTGISIELWRHVADQLKWRYRFVETPTVTSLLDGLSVGNFDVSIAAITVTPEREQTLDFTTPYFTAGTGIAVQSDRIATWMPVLRSIASVSFLQATLVLLGLAFVAGWLIWLFERKSNENFGGGLRRGLSSGVWWSTHAMTQRVTGVVSPMTLPGRIVAMIWMVFSVIALAVFTAGITSSLTTKRLHGIVTNVGDLQSVRVGAVAGTATEESLSRMRINYKKLGSPELGLKALRSGSIDAFVYDRPLLAYLVRQGGSSVELTDIALDQQSYAMALRNDSVLRKPLNVALLHALESEWWKDTQFQYLGARR